jgi:hypothetical protein
MEKKFPEGIFYNDAHANAPEWVRGSLSIRKQDFSQWLSNQQADEQGYIKLDIMMGKSGKPYLAVNEWRPKQEQRKMPF